MLNSVVKTRKKYQDKLRMKTVTFYLCDTELFNFANTINFQKFVKTKLAEEMNAQKILEGDTHGHIQED